MESVLQPFHTDKSFSCGRSQTKICRCDLLRSFTMWCLEMPDCMAWRGCTRVKLKEWFPAGEPNRAFFRARKLAMTSVVILAIWLTDLSRQLFRGIPFGKWGIFTFDSIKGIKEGLQCCCATHSALVCHQRCQQRKEMY